MHLKSLQLQGYKSFATRVQFEFDQGITAIVGPNGSGKSNVADAIRWVLGEQSYNLLRGKKTEDMIFSGSTERARLGMAAVSLVLDNSDGWLPLDFSEVTIARRAYRSGENEYLLNNSRVRLRDISELLAKSGLNRQTYTVVGQGTIDRALSLRPEERRQLFEEAAGITFHRQQRLATLKRLDETQDNLIRLNDIVKEIEPRLRRLQRQAERASEYEGLKSHLDDLLRTWYGFRWRQGQIALHEARRLADESQSHLEKHRRRLAALEGEIDDLRNRQTEGRAQLGQWHAESRRLHGQAETLQRELAVGEERARLLSAQREELLSELGPLEADLSNQAAQVTQIEGKLGDIEIKLQQAQARFRRTQQKLEEQENRQRELLSRQDKAEVQARRLANELAQQEARLNQLSERCTALLAQKTAQEQEIARHNEKRAALQAREVQLQAQITQIEQEIAQLASQAAKVRAEQQQAQAAASDLERKMSDLDRQMASLGARQDLLSRLRRDLSGYRGGVRTVLQAAERGSLTGVLGTVGQCLRAPAGLEPAIEAVLGGQLQSVIVQNWAAAEAAIAYLKAERAGRVTFLPLASLRPPPPVTLPDAPGILGLAAELVDYEETLGPVFRLILNRALVVEDLAAARRAFEELKGSFQIVTLAGEVIRSGGAISGGTAGKKGEQGNGLLAREREWRELPGQIEALKTRRNSLQKQLETRRAEEQSLQETLEALAGQQEAGRLSQAEIAKQLNETQTLGQRLEAALELQRDLQQNLIAELDDIARREVEGRQRIKTLTENQAEAEEAARQLARQIAAVSTESLLADLNQAKTAVALAEGQHQNQQALLQNHRRAHHQLANRIAAKQERIEALAGEHRALSGRLEQLRQEAGVLNEQISALAQEIEPAELQLVELGKQQAERERSEAALRQQLHRLEREDNRRRLELARREDDLNNLQRQIEDDFGLVDLPMTEDQIGQRVLPFHPLVSELPVVEVLPSGVEEDIRRLKVQIRRLGAINPDAPREHAELRQRHDFLTGQMADLEAAIADLRTVIAELDDLMETAFNETFQKASKAFQGYFKALFGGGEAQLILTDPNNLTETGVDIVARPPGKRLQSLALLSGGERSLAAQALLFALLRTSPTPFVVLDEVDAMLDEANIGRFRAALTELAEEIQFIIITHNRKTIEAANTIYGISMGDDSVSRVVSRKLDDIED
ncbi:MAG: chromosome segregation protein SMC [Anaerolineae bacterium]